MQETEKQGGETVILEVSKVTGAYLLPVMAKREKKVEELLELMKDEKVTELMVDRLVSLSPAIEEILERKIDKIIDKVLAKINPVIKETIDNQITTHFEILQAKQALLEMENDRLRIRLDHMETEARQPNLVIYGLPETEISHGSKGSAEREATEAVLSLCNETLGLSIKEMDISSAYRLPKKGQEKHRTMIVKFVGMKPRNLVFGARFLLKKTRIYINEHLSSCTAQTYAKARGLVKEGKVASVWTAGGAVYLRASDKPGDKPLKIPNMKALEKFLHEGDLSLTSLKDLEKPLHTSGALHAESAPLKLH